MNRILAVRGRVLPVSSTPLTLHARLTDGSIVDGQSQIMRSTGIDRVWLTPDDVSASEEALTAIAEAELIVLGPGQPLHEPPAESCSSPRSGMPSWRPTPRASSSATWRPRRARRPGSTWRGTSRRSSRIPVPGLIDIVLANNNFGGPDAARLVGRTGQAALAAGRAADPAAGARGRGRSGQCPPSRPGPAGRRPDPRARARAAPPPPTVGRTA